MIDRRDLLRSSLGLAATIIRPPFLALPHCNAASGDDHKSRTMRFGLVTYMCGADWDLPTLLRNCEAAGADGVELRTGHAHKVEPSIEPHERAAVKQRFSASPVELVGLGCNEAFHHVDPKLLRASIGRTKEFIKLSHDVGGSGVKVKPNDFPEGVSHEKTIEQIGRSLNELAAFAADYGQQIRLEVHGGCAHLPVISAIMKVADHKNAAVCWNSNPQDLQGNGLETNFRLVQTRLGATTHVRQLDGIEYPYAKLVSLLKGIHYNGWLLIEASDQQPDRVAALRKQRIAFDKLLAN